jgi:hypothetical protein
MLAGDKKRINERSRFPSLNLQSHGLHGFLQNTTSDVAVASAYVFSGWYKTTFSYIKLEDGDAILTSRMDHATKNMFNY